MDVTIMQSTASLVSRLSSSNPGLSFVPSDNFSWSPSNHTVYFIENDNNVSYFLLHELAHALLHHADYTRDIELIAMERQAWDQAIDIGKKYGVTIGDGIIQTNLDSYRDWLHARSTCPKCTATGVQDTKNTYSCLACGHKWRVNEARVCQLRRYSL